MDDEEHLTQPCEQLNAGHGEGGSRHFGVIMF